MIITEQFIHGEVKFGNYTSFFLTSIYAYDDSTDRVFLWSMLKTLVDSINSPWLVMGDFNYLIVTGKGWG